LAVLEEEIDEQRAACLLRIRRLVVAREKQGVKVVVEEEKGTGSGGTSGEEKWKRTLAFVVGLDGDENGCPIFTVVMDLLLPVWSLLRKPLGGYKDPREISLFDEEW
jgi:hypothetical protein